MSASLPRPPLRHARGFTLAEIIVVMVLTGILSAIVAVFIKVPVTNYINARALATLTDTADLALRRMRRDVRLSLPNSVRLSPDERALEFILTKAGGRYLSIDDGQPASRNILSFTNAAALTFDIVGPVPTGNQAIVPNADRIVVYNLGPGFAPADAYAGGSSTNIATVTAINGNTVTLASNPFALQVPLMESPTRRFQVVSGPVTYYCNGFDNSGDGTLRRYDGYALSADQVVPPGGTYAILAGNVKSCAFTFETMINEPKALIGMALVLRDPADTTVTVSLAQHVHVDNTP